MNMDIITSNEEWLDKLGVPVPMSCRGTYVLEHLIDFYLQHNSGSNEEAVVAELNNLKRSIAIARGIVINGPAVIASSYKLHSNIVTEISKQESVGSDYYFTNSEEQLLKDCYETLKKLNYCGESGRLDESKCFPVDDRKNISLWDANYPVVAPEFLAKKEELPF